MSTYNIKIYVNGGDVFIPTNDYNKFPMSAGEIAPILGTYEEFTDSPNASLQFAYAWIE